MPAFSRFRTGVHRPRDQASVSFTTARAGPSRIVCDDTSPRTPTIWQATGRENTPGTSENAPNQETGRENTPGTSENAPKQLKAGKWPLSYFSGDTAAGEAKRVRARAANGSSLHPMPP